MAPFTLTVDLTQGDVIRFANAAGSAHDASFDLTALRFTITLNPQKATPVITWSNPMDITYGTALGNTQLNAAANVAGTFTYTPVSGTVLNAGMRQSLMVTFTPTDTANYNTATKTVAIDVLKATPSIMWSNPADIIYGTALSGTQLNATANVAGSFVYLPASGTVLNAGNAQTLSVTFTPTATTNYNTAIKSVTINVLNTSLKATPMITWNPPAFLAAGATLSAAELNATANVPGTFSYTPPLGTVLTAGPLTLMANFMPTDTVNYNVTSKSVTTTVLNTCGITINPVTLPAATLGTPFVQTLSGSPVGSYTFRLFAGTLPPGVSLVNVLGIYSLRGTPTTAGTYTFTILATKNNSICNNGRTYTMVIPPR